MENERKVIWGCRWGQLRTPLKQLESVLGAMCGAAKAEIVLDGDEKAVYLVSA